MVRRIAVLGAVVLAGLVVAEGSWGQEKPGGAGGAGAGGAGGIENELGKMQVRSLAPIRYVYVTAKTRLEGGQLGKDIQRMVDQLMGEAKQRKLPGFRGSMIFQYEGVAPGKEFTLKIGYDAPAGVEVKPGELPEGVTFEELPEFKGATALYMGEMSGLPGAWGELMQEIQGAMLEPSGTGREYYLYWEGPQSKNNVVMLASGVK